MVSRFGLLTLTLWLCAGFVFAQGGIQAPVYVGPPPSGTAAPATAPGVLGSRLSAAPTGPAVISYSTSIYPNTQVVVDAPYSMERVYESMRVLADGTRLTNTRPNEKLYRDSQGRTRTERAAMSGPPGMVAPTVVEIRDPVAGFAYILDSENKVIHRVKLQMNPNMQPYRPAAQPSRQGAGSYTVNSTQVMSNGVVTKSEHLGFQQVEGVEVQGTRTTMTYPAGYQGADREIAVIIERWSSPYFGSDVLYQTNDPRSGTTVNKLINISVANPDPGLFAPPLGWAVVDEEGTRISFPIKVQAGPVR